MQHDELRELAALYALDALPDDGTRGGGAASGRLPGVHRRAGGVPRHGRRSWRTPRPPARRRPRCAPGSWRRRCAAGAGQPPACRPRRLVPAPSANPWWLAAAAVLGRGRWSAATRWRCAPTSASSIRSCARRGRRPQTAQRQLDRRCARSSTRTQVELQRVGLTTTHPRVPGRDQGRSQGPADGAAAAGRAF